MSRATTPVSINGVSFDALIEQTHELTSTVPQYSVESGFSVSDAIICEPEKLGMTLLLTDTPVTWRRNGGTGSAERRARMLENLYYSSTPVTVVTSERAFTNMAITTLSILKSADVGYAKEISLEFQKIRVTSSSTTTIPDYYGKSGETEANAGTANTTAGNVGGSGPVGTSKRDGLQEQDKGSTLLGYVTGNLFTSEKVHTESKELFNRNQTSTTNLNR